MANMRELVPPTFLVRLPATHNILKVFNHWQGNWQIEIEYVEKHIIVKDVDRCSIRAVVVGRWVGR